MTAVAERSFAKEDGDEPPWACVGCQAPTHLAWAGVVPYCGKCDWEQFKKAARDYMKDEG